MDIKKQGVIGGAAFAARRAAGRSRRLRPGRRFSLPNAAPLLGLTLPFITAFYSSMNFIGILQKY